MKIHDMETAAVHDEGFTRVSDTEIESVCLRAKGALKLAEVLFFDPHENERVPSHGYLSNT